MALPPLSAFPPLPTISFLSISNEESNPFPAATSGPLVAPTPPWPTVVTIFAPGSTAMPLSIEPPAPPPAFPPWLLPPAPPPTTNVSIEVTPAGTIHVQLSSALKVSTVLVPTSADEGAQGANSVRTCFDGSEYSPAPILFTAATLKLYEVPSFKPVTTLSAPRTPGIQVEPPFDDCKTL